MNKKDRTKAIDFLCRNASGEDSIEYRKSLEEYFNDYSDEDCIRDLATYVWDNSHGDPSNLQAIISELFEKLPEYFGDVMAAAISGDHDT